MVDDTIYLYLNSLNRKENIYFFHNEHNSLHCVLSLHRYGQYIQTYRTHGYFNGNPFSDRCHGHVPDFIDRYVGCAVYQTEIFNGTSNNNTHFAMEYLYRGLSLSVVLLYGNIRF